MGELEVLQILNCSSILRLLQHNRHQNQTIKKLQRFAKWKRPRTSDFDLLLLLDSCVVFRHLVVFPLHPRLLPLPRRVPMTDVRADLQKGKSLCKNQIWSSRAGEGGRRKRANLASAKKEEEEETIASFAAPASGGNWVALDLDTMSQLARRRGECYQGEKNLTKWRRPKNLET